MQKQRVEHQLLVGFLIKLNLGSPYVYIVDKNRSLRGRNDDDGIKFGYDSRSVADINNFMVDDVKVILAEYRLALKKNGITRKDL